MREDIIEKAYAKINISLDVTARRDDGYHDMAMVMQTVSLCDDVRLGFTDGSRIFARTNLPFIPSDERNLAVRAAKKFFEAAGEPERGLCIRIDKRIPVGAGMAGGSTDAAAVLRGLNRAFGNRFGVERLEELGAEVGSDVAFCVRGGTMLARGRGELLTPLPEEKVLEMPEKLRDVYWPQTLFPLHDLFERFPQDTTFEEGADEVFIRVPLGGAYGEIDHYLVGARIADGWVTAVGYLIPGEYAETPPAGMSGYEWRDGYWQAWQTVEE